MSISFKVKTLRKRKFASFAAPVRAAINVAVDRGLIAMHATAVRSVTDGPATGNIYGNHRASAPGEAPSTDTGVLRASIVIVSLKASAPWQPAAFSAKAAYASWLEYGTQHMAARPFMHPAFDAHINNVRKDIERATQMAFDDIGKQVKNTQPKEVK